MPKPPFAGRGNYYFDPAHGHFVIEGGPLFGRVNSLRLPEAIRGPRWAAFGAFAKLVGALPGALEHAEEPTGNRPRPGTSDSEVARSVVSSFERL